LNRYTNRQYCTGSFVKHLELECIVRVSTEAAEAASWSVDVSHSLLTDSFCSATLGKKRRGGRGASWCRRKPYRLSGDCVHESL